ncbi:unnamed protein product [Linum trigynum]|uniref:Uncharacterized protein n=1 Tax=Linum trigynum TaxID=586398 RepID=A0AAV2FKM0_9ROSI
MVMINTRINVSLVLIIFFVANNGSHHLCNAYTYKACYERCTGVDKLPVSTNPSLTFPPDAYDALYRSCENHCGHLLRGTTPKDAPKIKPIKFL